jgi:tetratricopeptide (TPR) repeat protein
LVRGDLDWIVLKCLEKDRARRYETANALLMDIQRHLSNEPVNARPRSRLYEFQKTVRRHKVGFAATAAVILTLFVGMGISTWSLVKEKRARQRADTEAAKSVRISRFLEDMLQSIDPKAAKERDTSLLQEVLSNTVERVARDLTNQPLVEAHLENTIGNIYAALGQFQNAEQMTRNAVALRRRNPATQQTELAESLFDLAHHLWSQGKLDEAERCAREGLSLATNAPVRKSYLVANSLAQLGVIVQDQGKLAEAEGLFRESLEVRKQLLGNEDPRIGPTLNSLSGVLALEGKHAEADKASREALKFFGSSFAPVDSSDDQSLYSRGNVLFEKGNLAEAEGCFRQALALRRKRSAAGQDLEVALSSLATTLRRQQRFGEAEPLYRECLASRETNCPSAWYTFYTRAMLGATLLGKRKYEEAEPLLISGYEGMGEREDKIRDRNKVLAETLQSVVQLFEATSRPEQAAEWKDKLAMVQGAGPKARPAWPRFSVHEEKQDTAENEKR